MTARSQHRVSPEHMDKILELASEIRRERYAQHGKWGTQRHEPRAAQGFPVWIVVAGEEFGEICQAVLTYRQRDINVTEALDFDERTRAEADRTASLLNMREEAIQLAAVCMAMVEHIDEELDPS